jgi:hypothetical protein
MQPWKLIAICLLTYYVGMLVGHYITKDAARERRHRRNRADLRRALGRKP